MENTLLNSSHRFVKNYLRLYSQRELDIVAFFDDNFIGFDGISTTIYNKQSWIKAIEHDFHEIKNPFEIKITDLDSRLDTNGCIIVAAVSLWYIPVFENAPEFDKIRTVFVLKPNNDTFNILHLSNSISLLPLNNEDVYPTQLLDFLKKSKDEFFKIGKIKDK
ncbi:nuclear transport factor 2 family protein [Psychroserpens sp. Hel_I_66]|uniref:nuclear transport factor 2 family protein n=1 Tax=Psychroserpens sp. Hel_I_66 TaxID=1250004 RepID=UPI0006486D91|nr:nuclear transport factor 2 family protein [Psychroserpens sp. Hel_I_66]